MTKQRRTSTDEVVRELERRIHSSELTADEKLPSEAALAIEFAVSRTVIRESLGYLRERGYLYTINGRGTFVRYPDAETMSTVIERHLRFSQDNNIKPVLNPVSLFAATVCYLHTYPEFDNKWEIFTFHNGTNFSKISSREILLDLR